MQLSEFLALRHESDSAFALRFRAKFRIGCGRLTVRQWRTGARIPAAIDKDRVSELTAGLVTLADWHELELNHPRSKARAEKAAAA